MQISLNHSLPVASQLFIRLNTRSPKIHRWLVTVLGLFFLNCATEAIPASRDRCLMTRGYEKRFPDIQNVETLELGERYNIQGIFYSSFEDSGFIPEPYIGEEYLFLQKVRAFCVKVEEDCSVLLDLKNNGKGTALVAEIKAVVVFESLTGSAGELSPNQCVLGTVRVERIRSIRIRRPHKNI